MFYIFRPPMLRLSRTGRFHSTKGSVISDQLSMPVDMHETWSGVWVCPGFNFVDLRKGCLSSMVSGEKVYFKRKYPKASQSKPLTRKNKNPISPAFLKKFFELENSCFFSGPVILQRNKKKGRVAQLLSLNHHITTLFLSKFSCEFSKWLLNSVEINELLNNRNLTFYSPHSQPLNRYPETHLSRYASYIQTSFSCSRM